MQTHDDMIFCDEDDDQYLDDPTDTPPQDDRRGGPEPRYPGGRTAIEWLALHGMDPACMANSAEDMDG